MFFLFISILLIPLFFRLQLSYDDQLAKELILLSKWQEKADSLNTWLDNMEEYLNNLHLTSSEENEDEKDLSSAREDFEVIFIFILKKYLLIFEKLQTINSIKI